MVNCNCTSFQQDPLMKVPFPFNCLRGHSFLCFLTSRHGIATVFICGVVLTLLLNGSFHYIAFKYNIRGSNDESNHEESLLLLDQTKGDSTQESLFQLQNNVSDARCEVVHIGLVCTGAKSNLLLETMLKSIYFHRRNPLHFHLIVDGMSKKVLNVLFQTWDVTQVEVTFYNVEEIAADVRWVPNSHYSGVYGLIKLTFPKIVPLTVTDRLIVVDVDITFVSDVHELWQYFAEFAHGQAIGLVENESNFYLRKDAPLPWPAIGRGFNTGVILYDLNTLQRLDWNKMWVNVTRNTLADYGYAALADQDIINAVVKSHPTILYTLPCQWNTQLSDNNDSYKCYQNSIIKVIHWNSPRKFDIVNRDADYFRTIVKTYLQLNGDLMRKQLYECPNFAKISSTDYDGPCAEFEEAQSQKWRTFLFLNDFQYIPIENDITLATQLSYDRLHMVEDVCRYWSGPISLTFYISDPELEELLAFIRDSEILEKRTNIAYHAVFKKGSHYPVNELRNIGLRYVNTPYVFLTDIDFLPMRNMYTHVRKYIGTLSTMKRKALVIPAFETQKYKSRIPNSKRELLDMVDKKLIFTFRYDVWPVGHTPTNYTRWLKAKSPYIVKWQPDFEPYVVVESNVVEYERRFLGFGWNKVSHIMELEAQNYEFIVLPNVFLVHKPHAPSSGIRQFRNNSKYRMCIQNLKKDFVQGLFTKYGRSFDFKNSSLIV